MDVSGFTPDLTIGLAVHPEEVLMSRPTLPPEILSLPIPERVAIVQELWDSIAADESAFELTPEQKAELEQRLAKRAESPNRSSSWEDVKARIVSDS